MHEKLRMVAAPTTNMWSKSNEWGDGGASIHTGSVGPQNIATGSR